MPMEHSVGALNPDVLKNDPAGQIVHTEYPVVGVNVPATHAAVVLRPVEPQKRPGSHAVHAVDPVKGA